MGDMRFLAKNRMRYILVLVSIGRYIAGCTLLQIGDFFSLGEMHIAHNFLLTKCQFVLMRCAKPVFGWNSVQNAQNLSL